MNIVLKKIGIGSAIAFTPFLALAQLGFGTTLGDIFGVIGQLIGFVTPIVIALALLYFFWGLAGFILNSDSEEARTAGRNRMIWGIIAFFVMISVWGLVSVLQETFGVSSASLSIPGIDFTGFETI